MTSLFEELKDELQKILNISDFTPCNLQQEKIRFRVIQIRRNLGSEKSKTDGYNKLLMGYDRSPVRKFESYLRIVVALDEDGIQINL